MGTGSCLPERIIPNSYFEKILDTRDEWIVARTGIQTRRMIKPGQGLSDLATWASEKALEMAGIPPEKLDMIIVGTSTADMMNPSSACIVQHRLGRRSKRPDSEGGSDPDRLLRCRSHLGGCSL